MTEKPIPPELRFLIEAERSRPDAPAEARAITQAKLAGLLGPIAGLGGAGRDGGSSGPIGNGSGASSAGGRAALQGALGVPAAKALALFALGGLVGGGVATEIIRPAPRIVYVERPVSAPPPVPSLAPPSSAQAEIVPPLPSARASTRDAAAASAPQSSSASAARGRDTDLAAERAIVERARSALARGDAPGALVSIAEHQREFPRGQLVEEREALAVQALVTAGRAQEAAARGARFRQAFPNSLLLPLVDQALR